MKTIKKILLSNSFLILAVIFFLFFNFNYLFSNALLKGDDASSLYYPGIYYLKDSLSKGIFPFYTEKMFAGYPIYQYSEVGYLNPLRIILTIILPFEKVLPAEYLIFFLLGVTGYFKLLREKKINESAIFFSHFIFFYNFQFLGRFVHQQLIFTVMLLPLLLYFTYKFFNEDNQKKKKLSIIYSGLIIALTILYGSFPGIFLLLFSQFIFIITELIRKENFKSFFKFYFFFFLLFISFSLYSLYPTYSLYSDSARNIEEFSLTKGSISPILLISSFITPFPLGDFNNYLGENFSSSWYWHEIHTYQGFAFFLLVILGFIYLKNVEFKNFFVICFSFFIILATLKYSLFGNLLDFFPFNLFRYHLRFGAIFAFALSIIGASIIHKITHEYERNEFLIMLKNIIFLLVPLALLSYVSFSSLNFYETKTLITHFKNAVVSSSIPYFKISFLASVFILVLAIVYKFIRRKSLLVCLPIIAVIELMLFANIIYSENLVVKSLINQDVEKITKFYSGKRVVFDNKIYGNQTLYYSNWNVYGYSAFDQKNYKDFMEIKNLNVRRYKESNYYLLDKLGVFRVIDENYNIHGISNGYLFNQEYEEISLNENHKIFKFKLAEDQVVTSFIKYDKNIEVLVNNNRVEFPKTKEIFYELDLSQGESLVEFIYRPKELYLGIILGLFTTIFSLLALRIVKV